MKTKTYVITGSTSGIGNELIKKLAKNNIIFAGYRQQECEAQLKSISENIIPFYVDYAKPETIRAAVEYIKSKCKKIDTLVNVAGCVVAGPIEKIDINEIKRQFNVNVFGHIEFSQGLIDLLAKGKIINVSSMASFGVFPFIAPYCASKKCLDMFFNSLLIENKKNIHVISVKPGVISTTLWEKSIVENEKYFGNCNGYENEMTFMVANARRNAKKGLSVQNVVNTILKADRAIHPKLSYTVGKDAFWASIFSNLPQGIINNLIKLGLNYKLKKYITKIKPKTQV